MMKPKITVEIKLNKLSVKGWSKYKDTMRINAMMVKMIEIMIDVPLLYCTYKCRLTNHN